MMTHGTDPELDKLVDSDDYTDRLKAAKQGYGLDKLINDKEYYIRGTAENYLKEHNYKTVFDWAKDNGVDINIDEWINSNDVIKRIQVVKAGYGLDILVHDYDSKVREEVAKQGYGLDILINDIYSNVHEAVENYLEDHNYKSVFDWAKDNGIDIIDEWLNSDDWRKRDQVAKAGYGLDVLVHDKYSDVREAVAKQGYGLDILVNDEATTVREAVAKQGYGLNILVNDKADNVRKAVAEQGYGLDKLINDEYWLVRDTVNEYLDDHNYKSVFDWANDNGVNIDIDEWLNSDDWIKRLEVAKAGYHLDVLINDEIDDIRSCAALQCNNLDILIHSKDYKIRCEVARQGYGLDVLVYDTNPNVRCEVARQGYGFDILVHDTDPNVRAILASQGYRLDILIYDEYDTNYDDDDDYDHYECVHDAVLDYLREHNYKTIFDWAKDNNIEIDVDKWLYATDHFQRDQLAMAGYCLHVLIYDEDWDVRRSVSTYLEEHNYKTIFDWAKDNNINLNIDEWSQSDNWAQRYEVAKAGYHLDVLIHDKDEDVRDAVNKYLKNNNLTMKKWMEQNGSNASTVLETIQYLESFIHKVEDSSKIKVETSYDSVEEFFEDTADDSYEDKESITIITADTKIPIIKLEKTKINDKDVFNFIANISIETEDFSIKSIFETKEKFNQLVQSTITNLREYSQFVIYADELENCL